MKSLLTSTALLLCTAGAAFAQTAEPAAPAAEAGEPTATVGIEEVMGARLYRSDDPIDPEAGVQDDWDDVGEISDFAAGADGLASVTADIGGFLGIGETGVTVNAADLVVLRDADGIVSVVTQQSVEELTAEGGGETEEVAVGPTDEAAEGEPAEADETEAAEAEATNAEATAAGGEASAETEAVDAEAAEGDGDAPDAEAEATEGEPETAGDAEAAEGEAADAETAETEAPADADTAEASPGPETTPAVDGGAESARTAGTIDVDQEGSGMTTQSGVDLQANRSGAPVTPMNDQEAEGTTTNVPTLDDGTVVDNPQTPATAVIEGGEVQTDTASGEAGATDAVPAEGDAAEDAGAASNTEAEAEADAPAGADTDVTGGAGTDQAESDAEVAVNAGADAASMQAPAIERDGYATVQYDDLALPQLEGIDVYDAADESVGEIGYTVNAAASGTEGPLAIIDVGGFLGLGVREVAVPLTALTILEGEDGLRAYVDATADELEQMPEYED